MATSGAAPDGADNSNTDPLDRIHELLRFVAGGGQPTRKTAVDYLGHRSSLLASPLGEMLPGFLYQCGTVDRFRDFIMLYDPDAELRCEFVDRMIGKARRFAETVPALAPAPRQPPRASSPATPPIWEF